MHVPGCTLLQFLALAGTPIESECKRLSENYRRTLNKPKSLKRFMIGDSAFNNAKYSLHLCRALVAIGCFTIVSSAIGYFGSQFRPVFLSLFLIVGTFATTLQLVLVLVIFGAQEKVADEIETADSISGVKHFDKYVCPILPHIATRGDIISHFQAVVRQYARIRFH